MAAIFHSLETKLKVTEDGGKTFSSQQDRSMVKDHRLFVSNPSSGYYTFKKSSSDKKTPIFKADMDILDLNDNKMEFGNIGVGDLVEITFALVKYQYGTDSHGLRAVPYELKLIWNSVVEKDAIKMEEKSSPSKGNKNFMVQAPKRFRTK